MGSRIELLNRFVVAQTSVFCRRKPSVLGRELWEEAEPALHGNTSPKDRIQRNEVSDPVLCTARAPRYLLLAVVNKKLLFKAFQSSLKGTLGVPTPSHTWFESSQPLAGGKGMSNLFSEEGCFESQ